MGKNLKRNLTPILWGILKERILIEVKSNYKK